ncbi:hypothetical protein HPP92_007567 [Vanilla planifolia]|uniref:UGP3-like C-terminal hexapeptide repeats domain-containing protein n=1 Tax=Vanilla planifolia TaxID=51239 RepID=A0A835VA73_VANPL|nr:hypothetical protein HPP92_007567 [Vanilla planifolia]
MAQFLERLRPALKPQSSSPLSSLNPVALTPSFLWRWRPPHHICITGAPLPSLSASPLLSLLSNPKLAFSAANSPPSHSSSYPPHSPLLLLTSPAASPLLTLSKRPLGFDIEKEIVYLDSLRSRLRETSTLREKLRVLDAEARVKDFFCCGRALSSLDLTEEFLLKCLVAAGQGHVLDYVSMDDGVGFGGGRQVPASGLKEAFYRLINMIETWDKDDAGVEVEKAGKSTRSSVVDAALNKLLKTLDEVEKFYDCIGGIIGYQLVVLELLLSQTAKVRSTLSSHTSESFKNMLQKFHVPFGTNLLKDIEYASQAALWGLEGLPVMGEIYPLGGAGDRLGLVDPTTGECLPAAMLPFNGKTLLEVLIKDLQAREHLYFKVFGKQCTTPVAIMTSSVKNNHKHISALFEKHGWFGRGRQNFHLFEQPMVPVVSAEDGQWLCSGPLSLVCKPGGHGAIWKLAYDKGVFEWFYSHGRKAATVRQVSNVVAATDVTLLALAGIGLKHEKKLGFASCRRNFGATEGINVLIEKENGNGHLQAEFPANTNVLYIDLKAAEMIGASKSRSCLPGMVLNLKKPVTFVDDLGTSRSMSGGRLECTMQNIADSFRNTYAFRCNKGIEIFLKTLIRLLSSEKFFGGAISEGSELQIEVTEFYWRDVQLDGSLIIVAENALGSTTINSHGEQILHYGQRCGRCKLENVKVLNRIDWSSPNHAYWKEDIKRFEMLKVLLHGNAEFEAMNVVIEGNHVFKYRMATGCSSSHIMKVKADVGLCPAPG